MANWPYAELLLHPTLGSTLRANQLRDRFCVSKASLRERVLFAIVGLAFLGTCFHLIYLERVTEAAAVFGLGFLSFIYANVSRFKRFRGLGFEAELWEDKQEEASDLIERLREVVSIYTREVILGKVTAGRWIDEVDWASRWKLYDDLITQHNVLGQKIDFTGVKKVMTSQEFESLLRTLRTLSSSTAKSGDTTLKATANFIRWEKLERGS